MFGGNMQLCKPDVDNKNASVVLTGPYSPPEEGIMHWMSHRLAEGVYSTTRSLHAGFYIGDVFDGQHRSLAALLANLASRPDDAIWVPMHVFKSTMPREFMRWASGHNNALGEVVVGEVHIDVCMLPCLWFACLIAMRMFSWQPLP